MKLQLLVSTMRQTDYNLIQQMNIRSAALVVNQESKLFFEEWEVEGKLIQWFSSPERGIGLSRNTALFHAKGEICLFADDDVIYTDEYEDIILSEFSRQPKADVIIFNMQSINTRRPEPMDNRKHKVHFYNYLRYGAFRIAFRTHKVQKARICFSQLYGGGSLYGSGEDNLFLTDCIRKGLRIYASPQIIGTVNHQSSTWFSGFDEKFFFDKGALFASIEPKLSKLLCFQFCLRHGEMLEKYSFSNAYKTMLLGVEDYKRKFQL